MWEKITNLFRSDLSTTPLETALFLGIIFGFFIILIVTYKARQKRERTRLSRIREEKWHHLCMKYNISDEEVALLEDMSKHLQMPEKKYLLIADHKTFHHALRLYSEETRPEARIVQSIIKKTKMKREEQEISDLPVQRRRSVRLKVDISALISSVEDESADIPVRMHDLSRGGCRLENPEGRFRPGDDVKVSFEYMSKRYKDIPATVVRTSSNRSILHLSFGHVNTEG